MFYEFSDKSFITFPLGLFYALGSKLIAIIKLSEKYNVCRGFHKFLNQLEIGL